MKLPHWLWGQDTPLAAARRQLIQARLGRLEAASMRESWAGYEETLNRRIKRLEGVVEALEKEEGK